MTFLSFLEQATGIEPAARPWEGRVLPLYDACDIHYFTIPHYKCANYCMLFRYEKLR